MNRRDWLITSAAVTGSAVTVRFRHRKYSRDLRPKQSRVAILHADQYSDRLDELVYEGLRLFNLKNMFGIVPGSRYGWPKNILHWAGIHESILDICATVRPHFVIADGIVGMEGDGPLNGTAKELHTILLSDDPVAADSILARF